jgi:hypothetical protein
MAIASCTAEISVEFTATEATSKILMGPNGQPSGSSKRRRRAMPATPPVRRTSNSVEWRPMWRQQRRGLRRHWLGRRRRASLPSHGSSLTSATMTPQPAEAQAIRSKKAGCWSLLTLGRRRCFLPKRRVTTSQPPSLSC